MMFGKANKYENYTIAVVKRSDIQKAEYNPRIISDENRKRLKKIIQSKKLVEPIVWNKQTGNLVGGHQRLSILDDLHKGKEYEVTVSVVDVDEKTEIELNVALNNPNTQGEWDKELLLELKGIYPDLDYEKDLFFTKVDLDFIGAETGNFEAVAEIFKETEEQAATIADIEAIKQAKKEHREKAKAANENGETHNVGKDDYYVTLVFNNNTEKWDFMTAIKKGKAEKFIPASVLHDIAEGKVKL